MKQLFILTLILALFAAAANAQQTHTNRLQQQRKFQSFQRSELNRPEARRLHRNEIRYKMARKKAYRDGIITRGERRQLRNLREYQRRELSRRRHNSHRLI